MHRPKLSSSGAAIWLPDAAGLPPKFDLLFDRAIRHCIAVCRHADLMGVKFMSEPLIARSGCTRAGVPAWASIWASRPYDGVAAKLRCNDGLRDQASD
jgi:hypothetical protein